MKIQILDINGKKIKEMQTKLFEEPVREDIISKVIEAQKKQQPYAPYYLAGMQGPYGTMRHKRHSWKSDRGRGISRIPRKIFWRRGTNFSMEGARIPFARGGRRAHPPKIEHFLRKKKINKKELKKALLSALTYITSIKELKKKYSSLKDKKIENKLPIIVEDKILSLKTKEFYNSLKIILGELFLVAVQKREIRAGKGKMRGRKYKKNAGALLVIGNKENKKIQGIEISKAKELNVRDLADGGARLIIFSENAIKELEKIIEKNKK